MSGLFLYNYRWKAGPALQLQRQVLTPGCLEHDLTLLHRGNAPREGDPGRQRERQVGGFIVKRRQELPLWWHRWCRQYGGHERCETERDQCPLAECPLTSGIR